MRTTREIAEFSKKWFAAALVLGSIAAASGPQESFDRLYASRLKAATTTAQKLSFAQELLKDAGGLGDDRPFQAYVYEKAYDLTATEPLGFSIAWQAMDDLANAQPELNVQIEEKRTAMLEHQCRTGPPAERQAAAAHLVNLALQQAEHYEDASDGEHAIAVLQKAAPTAQMAGRECAAQVAAQIKDLRVNQVREKHASELEARIENDPHDAKSALELVRLLVLDMDQPAKAVKIVPKAQDAVVTEAVLLAAKSPESLMPDQLARVGNWYHEQVPKASDAAKYVALHRASQYFGRFLTVYTKEDASRLGVRLSFESVQKELAKEPPPVPRRVIDLLLLVDAKKDALEGTWTNRGPSVIAASINRTTLVMRYNPPREYTLRATLEKPANSSIVFILPAGSHGVEWMMAWTDGICGFELINGKTCKDNGLGVKLPETQKAGVHTVELSIREGSITALLDGVVVSHYEGDFSALDLPFWDDLKGGALGIGVWNPGSGPTIFHRLELAEFRGRGRPLLPRLP